jgi:hypothetical protein
MQNSCPAVNTSKLVQAHEDAPPTLQGIHARGISCTRLTLAIRQHESLLYASQERISCLSLSARTITVSEQFHAAVQAHPGALAGPS